MKKQYLKHLMRDLVIIAASVAVAVWLARLGVVEKFMAFAGGFKILASFVAGMFFTSIFTTAPAMVALAVLARDFPPLWVALIGALGAVLMDFIIFRFVRDDLSKDAASMFRVKIRRKFVRLFQHGFLKWLLVLLGGLILASPFPDELGLAILGLAKVKNRILLPLSYVMNFLGILTIVSVARLFSF
ncbi:hypothetical protein A2906_02005 [Candidatus Nomurabacteria bacterium RIFCSPLOWO2_01_FULL_37_25]|nr:MAG: hypothetical protein A2906_02005 [Candidatus Nomurabacteria bacterium RIFCSPLOWO2_01_FULL_37_25]